MAQQNPNSLARFLQVSSKLCSFAKLLDLLRESDASSVLSKTAFVLLVTFSSLFFFFFYGPPIVPRCRRSLGQIRPLR
jgi:hypothetical protein